MDDVPASGRTRFDQNQPDGIAYDESEMDGEESGAGEIGQKDEASANDEVDQAGAKVD